MLINRLVCFYLTTTTTTTTSAFAVKSTFSSSTKQLVNNKLSRAGFEVVGGGVSTRSSRSMSSSSSNNNVGISDIGVNEITEAKEESLQSWRSMIEISIAKSRKVRGGNYVQIATIDPATNEPRCRTVVFRGFQEISPESSAKRIVCDDKSCIMKMITDTRSNKVAETTSAGNNANNGASEMVWWFSKSSEQYRIRGNLIFVGGGQFEFDQDPFMKKARKEQWGNLSDMAREQFFWTDPGIEYSGESIVPTGGRDENGKVVPVPDTFLLMLLLPKHVDYLRLGDNFRQIDELSSSSEEEWSQNRVNP
mmetsp:Transcript_23295/g.32539  ORF Transcript_23295/g.32539 Transcript_23295/m.32539 type:complete len:307 (+) Transcript_23295:92-1012(+)